MPTNTAATAGTGQLHLRRDVEEVTYEFKGDPATLRAGGATSMPSKPLSGAIRATPEIAEQAFREGRCLIDLDTGRRVFLAVAPIPGVTRTPMSRRPRPDNGAAG